MEATIEARKLKPYQKVALHQIIKHRGQYGLFLAPGTGKTIVAIRYAKRFKSILVICRRDDYMTWQQELEAEGEPEPYCVDSKKEFKALWPLFPEGDKWTLITYGLLRDKKIRMMIRSKRLSCAIADEGHYLKRWKAQQTKGTIRCTRLIPHRLMLTGSPITNSLEDVFSQCLFIDDGATFSDKWWTFMNRYFLRLRPPAPPAWVLKRGMKPVIMQQLKRVAMHVHEDDVLKLPPKRYVLKAVPMSKEQTTATERLIEEWEYEIAEGECVEVNHVVVKLSKLKQIAGGFLYPPKVDGVPVGKPRFLECTKLDLLESLMHEDLRHKRKIVIWCMFTAELFRINEILSHDMDCVMFSGAFDTNHKNRSKMLFATKPHVRCFIGQADSGVGMNQLIAADTAIYYSNSDRVVSRQQSERRIRRIGSEKHRAITYYDLISEGSIDVKTYRALKGNMDVAQGILDGIKQGKPLRSLLR